MCHETSHSRIPQICKQSRTCESATTHMRMRYDTYTGVHTRVAEWVVTSHSWMSSRVTLMNELCHTHVTLMNELCHTHVTLMNELCHTHVAQCEWVMSNIFMSHDRWVLYTKEWVMSHVWMSRVKYMHEPWQMHNRLTAVPVSPITAVPVSPITNQETYERVTWHVWGTSHLWNRQTTCTRNDITREWHHNTLTSQ